MDLGWHGAGKEEGTKGLVHLQPEVLKSLSAVSAIAAPCHPLLLPRSCSFSSCLCFNTGSSPGAKLPYFTARPHKCMAPMMFLHKGKVHADGHTADTDYISSKTLTSKGESQKVLRLAEQQQKRTLFLSLLLRHLAINTEQI